MNCIYILDKRVKRALGTLNPDIECPGQELVNIYGVDAGSGCNYLRICEK